MNNGINSPSAFVATLKLFVALFLAKNPQQMQEIVMKAREGTKNILK